MENIELEIIDYGYNGEGVSKKNGKVFFLPKTIVGEKVEAEIVKANSKFSFCRLLKIVDASSKRKLPPCPYYHICGGCNFQHISYDAELEIKKAILQREISKVRENVRIEVVKNKAEYAYRNKVRFKVKDRKVGFYEEKSNKFIEIKNCLLISIEMNAYIEKINEFLSVSKYKFDEVIIHSFEGEMLLDFLTSQNAELGELKNFFSCRVMLNHRGENIITESLGLRYEFSGDSFRQVNDYIAEKIYNEVLEKVDGKVVLNAFSGAGVLSAMIAKKAQRVYGIELNQNAHNCAESLKFINNIDNLTNICGYAEVEIERITDNLDYVIVDPPRAGCAKEFLVCVLSKEIPSLIYISCNPATLVRDLKILLHKYDIEDVKIYDMFSRTANMEVVIHLKLKCLTKS